MADLAAITSFRVVEATEQPRSIPCAVDITLGQVIGIGSTGKAVVARATTGPVLPKGFALSSAVAPSPTSILRSGVVDVGNILGGLAFGALVYASDTPGLLADAPVGGLAAIGDVIPAWAGAVACKLLHVHMGAR
jgi:hypothetical protein